jgi:hypothetical protein
MAYLGNTPTTQSFISGTDYFNGTGSQTAFTLTRTVASVNDIEAVVNNVVQQPNDAYNISGTTITFTSAPSAGTNNVYVRYLSTTTQAITPSQNTVSWNTLDANTQQDLGISGKNRIINGNMVIDQRNAGASVTVNAASQFFSVDRYYAYGQNTDGVYTLQQSSTAPAGFSNSLLATVTTADASIGASQFYFISQAIEGLNCTDLNWGSANAKTVTLSFWVRSSVTGTFGGSIRNADVSRSYAFTYTISSANTWEQKSITIVGDTSGTWLVNNLAGMYIGWSFGEGSSGLTTAGSWVAGSYRGATGQTNLIATNGATFYITGVQLEVGTQATTFTLAGGSYGAELALCQRYYSKSYNQSTVPGTNAGTTNSVQGLNGTDGNQVQGFRTPVTMRASATARIWSLSGSLATLSTTSEVNSGAGAGTWNPYGMGDSGCRAIVGSGGLSSSVAYVYHWDASAEL